jgi:hypothetical protein
MEQRFEHSWTHFSGGYVERKERILEMEKNGWELISSVHEESSTILFWKRPYNPFNKK